MRTQTETQNIIAQVSELGKVYFRGRRVMPDVFINVCKSAARGEIDEDDAEVIYQAYAKSAWHVTKIDTTKQSNRVQVSKIRKIIQLGLEHKRDGVALLERAMDTYENQIKIAQRDTDKGDDRERLRSAQDMLLVVTRTLLSTDKPPSKGDMVKLVRTTR